MTLSPSVVCVALVACISFSAAPVLAADKGSSKQPAARPESVELFDGIKSGTIDVKMYPRDEFAANVVIRNLTARPLSVRLPEAFAGVPVLMQRGPGGNNGRGPNQGNQQVGGAPNQQNNNRNNNGRPGGFNVFNIPPEEVVQFRLATVCLEHGKTAPRAGLTYTVKPLDTVTTAPGVSRLLVSLANGEVTERVAQAAAWHLANDLSWDDLKSKRVEHLDGRNERWFSADELAAAESAVVKVEQNEKESPGTALPGTRAAAPNPSQGALSLGLR